MFLNWLMLATVILGLIVQSVSQKTFNMKTSGGVFTFGAAYSLFAALFFVATSGFKLQFTVGVLIYSIFFSLGYATSVVGLFLAIKTGPLSLTTLINSLSLLIPTLYCLIVLKEPIKVSLIIGLVLLLVALVMINLKKKGEEKKVNFKWVIFVLLAFFGNGSCALVQKMQVQEYGSDYMHEFMIMALLLVFLSLGTVAVFTERKLIKPGLRGAPWFMLCGIFNGICNLLVMILSKPDSGMNSSVMFPVISGGDMVLTFIISRFFYKEKLTRTQDIGFILGVLSIIALNL